MGHVKPGQRVVLIEECADSLSVRTLPKAQIVLKQFGIDTYQLDPQDIGDAEVEMTYYLEQVGTADDEVLTDLHAFLVGENAEPEAPSTGLPWSGGHPARVFMSHQHESGHFMGEVKRRLAERFGIDAFVAHDDIEPSKQWRNVIKQALATCDAFAAFVDEKFHASQWCDQEVGWALGRGVPIIPIRGRTQDRARVHRGGFLEEHQDLLIDSTTADRWSGWPVAQHIFRIVVNDPRTRETVGVKALAEAFVRSGSYDTTRELWAMIASMPHVESEQLRRLEYAVQTNDQVYAAVAKGPDGETSDVPALVQRLVEHYEPPIAPLYGDDEPF